ncbi:MAG: type I-E CRISPR-associated protein Cse1/CasA [Chloroflexota bacterium]|nr:type I-E CRISPR-associated protein Cse1/CasA [Chloroflexota bacterium]
MPSFDLVSEPWIPCIRLDGVAQEYSLEGVLRDGPQIRELFDPSPLVTVSLHRLLLAILHRSHMGPTNMREWTELWRRANWDPDVTGEYLNRWRHRFDLFHPERPFYQVPEMPEAIARQPITLLFTEVSSSRARLFDHASEAMPVAVRPAVAARYLVAHQAFTIGFGKSDAGFYLRDGPLTRGYIVVTYGDNLFETLALNLQPYNAERPIPWRGDDLPAWEHEDPAVRDKAGTAPLGYTDYLTWQSRQIHLFAAGNPPLVSRCQRRQNLDVAGTPIDPFKCYVVDEQTGRRPRGLDTNRAIWRDSHTLLQPAGKAIQAPRAFATLARINTERQKGTIVARPVYRVGVFGIAAEIGNAANVLLWRHERLPLPLAYLEDQALADTLKQALDLAETSSDDLRVSCRLLAKHLLAPGVDVKGGREPHKDDISKLVTHLDTGRRYWARLEAPFRRLIVRLPRDTTTAPEHPTGYGETELPAWAHQVRKVARDAFAETTRGLDQSARALKATVLAQRDLDRRLKGHLGVYLEQSRREDADVPAD